jgi:cellulose synthase/poly-beta-1,6-N-acetylglucosamine synthase-like glycosyltransferase/peptidoglycan/xylan/chitin deacetylase (PgdA/CDA1 family)/spore germination protein YaaH
MNTSRSGKAIFHDPKKRRWRVVSSVTTAAAVALTVVLGITIVSVLISPVLPKLGLKAVAGLPQVEHLALGAQALGVRPRHHQRIDAHHGGQGKDFRSSRRATDERTVRDIASARPTRFERLFGRRPSDRGPPATSTTETPSASLSATLGAGFSARGADAADYRSKLIGFYVNWDDASLLSLREHIADFDLVIPEWLHLAGPAADITPDDPVQEQITLNYIRSSRPSLPVMPLVNNYDQGSQSWDGTHLASDLANPKTRSSIAERLLAYVQSQHLAGINIDFEDLQPASRKNLVTFMQTVTAKFHAAGLLVSESVPASDPAYDYKRLAASCDFLAVMVYDQHTGGSDPGPVASQSWFASIVAERAKDIPAQKLVVGVGSYGYDSAPGQATQPVTFNQALATARSEGASPTLDPASLTLQYAYTDAKSVRHQVWLLDAVSAFDQLQAAAASRPAGYALWRLGSEDPTIWPVLEQRDRLTGQTAARLRILDLSQNVAYQGSGEIERVTGKPVIGERAVEYNPARRLITAEHITSWASPYLITCWGGGDSKKVALTFDDGPDPYWTPKILDVLDENDVPGTFFIIGANGDANPAILKRELAIGEELGNHTFTHPDIAAVPAAEVKWQLDAVQRLFESLLGVRTVLFRPPYGEDAQPDTPSQVRPLMQTGAMGYYTVGMNVDPSDWARPGVGQIVERTVDQVESGRGHVVLLHDGGGDRSQTVEALPEIIKRLRADGYQFVTVSNLVGLPRSVVMPTVPARDRFFATVDRWSFSLFDWVRIAMYWLFMTGIVLGIARLAFVGSLAVAEKIRNRASTKHKLPAATPPVSVIVPAFNEESVIVASVNALLASEYPDLEIVVVDDGSTDATFQVAVAAFANEPRVRVLAQDNAGKAAALNHGIAEARGEIVIGMDADTIFQRDAIAKMVRHFSDPKVGAVAGNARVGNRVNLLTKWQALEYITNQNLDRRAFNLLNCITVVPGAIGAWRRDLIADTGGFTADTLAEDADLTFRVLRQGYRVVYEDEAIAQTEAPDTVSGLVKQRSRWVFGTLQTLWKHRDLLGRPSSGALGWVAVPSVLTFQVLFQLVSPVMDFVMVFSIAGVFIERGQHPLDWSMAGFEHILFYYALFLALDFITSALAFALEPGGEQWSLLWWLFLQRYFYRQLMYVVMWRAVVNAIRGTVFGWQKVERKATVAQTAE